MNKKILYLILLLLLPIRINALKENILLYNDNPTKYYVYNSVIVDEDKNIVVVGYSIDDATGENKSIIAKYKQDGTLIWEKAFLTTDRDNGAYGVTSTGDGYVVVGGSHVKTSDDDTDTSFDSYIYKISKDGEVVWHKEESTIGSDRFEKIVPIGEGYLTVGYNTSEYYIPSGDYVDKNAYARVIDGEGNKVWENTWGGNNLDWFYNAAVDGNSFLAVGYTSSTDISSISNFGEKDGLVVKYNSDGSEAWAKVYGTIKNDEIHNIYVLEDGYLLVGKSNLETTGTFSGHSYWFLKINKDGDIVWDKNMHMGDDDAWAIIPKDDKIYVFGYSMTNEENQMYESTVSVINPTTGAIENEQYTVKKSTPTLFRDAVAAEDGFIAVGFTRVLGSTTSEVFAAPVIVKYSFQEDTPGDDSHGAADPLPPTEEPNEQPSEQPVQKPQEENPKTGAFLTSGFVILILVGLLILAIRRKNTFNI